MKLTTKGRYAVTALLDIHVYGQKGPTTVDSLVKRQGISKAYLERITGQLRAKGLLNSVKGPGGGYSLAKSADKITIAEIIKAVKEPVDITGCKGLCNCQNGNMCLTHFLWDELNHHIMDYLGSVTLSSIAKRPKIMAVIEKQIQSFAEQEEEVEAC